MGRNALIEPTAPGTDSYELNRNLVLTPGAIADSEPNLEIENGNIIGAGHASSVGRFDDEELFYLESRGISEKRGPQNSWCVLSSASSSRKSAFRRFPSIL